MKRFDIAPAGLGAVRLQISPVHSLVGLLRLGLTSASHPWQRAAAGAVRRALAQPSVAVVRELLPARGVGNVPVMSLRPEAGAHTWAEELAAIEALEPVQVRADVAESGRDGPRVRCAVDAGTLGREVAAALDRLWRELLADDWPRVEQSLRAEVARVGGEMATTGVARAVDGLHPRVHWVAGDDAASIVLDRSICGRRQVGAEGLVLLPNVFLWDEPLVSVGARVEAIMYPCRPEQTRADAAAGGRRLARLMGVTRARVLEATTSPTTTTELAGRLELPVSTVSTHLAVLLEAGLVVRRRAGRSVIYERPARGA